MKNFREGNNLAIRAFHAGQESAKKEYRNFIDLFNDTGEIKIIVPDARGADGAKLLPSRLVREAFIVGYLDEFSDALRAREEYACLYEISVSYLFKELDVANFDIRYSPGVVREAWKRIKESV